MIVRILATCRKKELLSGTTMVFDTIRVGFPDSQIIVSANALSFEAESIVKEKCKENDCDLEHLQETVHHKWIECLMHESSIFVICDTDMIFHDRCDVFPFEDYAISGKFTPTFFDRFTKCVTMERLHTSLLYVNPVKVISAVSRWHRQFPVTPFNPRCNLIHPITIPRNIFYDTCSLLYHAIGGQPFTPDECSRYDHLHAGTWVDLLEDTYPGMTALHREVQSNPAAMKKYRQQQEDFYKQQRVELAHP